VAHIYSEKMEMGHLYGADAIKAHWYWYVASGVLLVLLGLASIVFPFAASIAGNYAIGAILVVAGVIQMVHGVQTRKWKFAGLSLVGGILAIVAGALLLGFPLVGVVTLTSVITAFLLVSGVFKIIYAFKLKPEPGYKWLAVSGVLAVLLALLVLSEWPQAAVWLLGLLIGFDLLFTGAWLITLALNARRADRA
jgi:uncharacterized membrane protein HdeD (DUF308 family)